MFYADIVTPLLNGSRARRRSWAVGVFIIFKNPGLRINLDSALAGAELGLLTPSGPHRYFVHSIDRRADDWEVLHGPYIGAPAPRGVSG